MPDSFDYTTGTNSENVRLLQALIDDAPEYTEETNSRNANILKSIINNTEYTDAPQSEIEELLLRLKAKIGGEIEVDELNVTENGTYDAGVNKAYNPVTVELPLDSKTITENGTYTASEDNLAGFNEVTVAVEGYAKKSIANTPTLIATFNASALPMPSLKVEANGNHATAYSLNSGSVMSDTSPYLYRASHSGSAVEEEIVGGTVAWNQLVQNGDFATTTRWDYSSNTFSVANNIGTFTAQSQGQQVTQVIPYILNHKYLGIMQIKTTTATESVWLRFFGQNKAHITATTNWQTVATIVNSIVDSTNSFGVRDDRTSSWDAIQIKNANLFDLTQAFGSTIADYVYSLEQAEAGSGIAWLKSYGFFTKDYYAYQSGKLESVNVASRKVYDSNNTLVTTYPLDSSLTLRGIPKLDSNNNLYYDGDVYEADGGVKRKYGVVDLGTLSWGTGSVSGGNRRFYATISDIKVSGDATKTGNIICTKYVSESNSTQYSGVEGICVHQSDHEINIYDKNYLSASTTEFKSAMSGIYLFYELATPTTESAQPYTNPQQVFSGGTEEFVDAGVVAQTRDVEIPVGQNSKYVDGEIYITYFKDNGQSMDVQDGVIDMVSGVLTVNNVDYQQERQPIWTKSGNNTFTASGNIQSGEYMGAL